MPSNSANAVIDIADLWGVSNFSPLIACLLSHHIYQTTLENIVGNSGYPITGELLHIEPIRYSKETEPPLS
jgi:hypothetical protein